jgi:hypothetical protein
MYKPNGEEPMTQREEMRRREAVAERASKAQKPESLRTAFYAALFGVASSRNEGVDAAFEHIR